MDTMGWIDLTVTTKWDKTSSAGRRIIKTADGWIGLAPGIAEPGDSIVIVKGGDVPLVVRQQKPAWEFIGEIYVHGIMHGEAFDTERCQPIWLA